MALVKGIIDSNETILVRVHALDLFSDVLGEQSNSRDGSELSLAMNTIAKNKNGIIILIRDSSSESLSNKISHINSKSSFRSNNVRDIGVGAQILLDLGVKYMTVLYNTSTSAIGLDGFGLTIKSWKKLG
jgi:3,4-dihydroxy 2-butanone 4-phosphate synthase/GTP cyclohydrolase II